MKPKNIDILVVEDDKISRELLMGKLENEGWNVSIAFDGNEALEKIEKESFQLVLLDLALPTIDGFEVLKRIKENPRAKKIPVVVLTNLSQPEEMETALKLGASDYLIKANSSLTEIVGKIKKRIEE
jgi:CheY-like chemotaxis protein